MSLEDSLVIGIHSAPGVGKTTLAATTPAPRLILDTEGGGSRFAFPKESRIVWDPTKEAIPDLRSCPNGACETVIVTVRNYNDIAKAYEWIATGKHPFRSLVMDSASEAQVRLLESVSGVKQPTQQQWGEVLRNFADLLRKFRDLTIHPSNPLQVVMITALSEPRNGRNTLLLQGKVAAMVPAIVDVLGYMYVANLEDGSGRTERRLLVSPSDTIDAKDRTGRLPPIIQNPNVRDMLYWIYGT